MAKKRSTSSTQSKKTAPASTARAKRVKPQTPPWVSRYLTCLRETGIAGLAARVAGVEPRVVDARLKADPAFAATCVAAIGEAVDVLEAEARRRALEGSDVLLAFLLRGALPAKYRTLDRLPPGELRSLAREMLAVLAAPPTADDRPGA